MKSTDQRSSALCCNHPRLRGLPPVWTWFFPLLFSLKSESKAMGHSKVLKKLNKSSKSRRNTFLKRSKGLKKKAYELATLCDSKVCIVCFAPDEMQQMQPQIWPNNPNEVVGIMERYLGLRKTEQEKEKLDRMKPQTKLSEPCRSWDVELDGLLMDKIEDLLKKLEMKLESVKRRKMEMQHGGGNHLSNTEKAPTLQCPDQMEGLRGPFICFNDSGFRPMDSYQNPPEPISWMKSEDQFQVTECNPMTVGAMVKMEDFSSLIWPSSTDSLGFDGIHDTGGLFLDRYEMVDHTIYDQWEQLSDMGNFPHNLPLQEIQSEFVASSSLSQDPIPLQTNSLHQMPDFFYKAQHLTHDHGLQLHDSNQTMISSPSESYGFEHSESLLQAHRFNCDLVQTTPAQNSSYFLGPDGTFGAVAMVKTEQF